MLFFSRLTSLLAILNLALPLNTFADGVDRLQVELKKSERKASSTLIQLQRSGTEFYSDRTKQKAIDLRDLQPNAEGRIKIFALTPYDSELKTSVGISESVQINSDGTIKLTLEILKNEPKELKQFPIRAIKSVTFNTKDASATRIKFTQTIQAAMSIAKNQLLTKKTKENSLQKFASKISETLVPSANANAMSVAAGTIAATGAVLMIASGSYLLKIAYKEGNPVLMSRNGALKIVGIILVASGVGLAYNSYELFSQ